MKPASRTETRRLAQAVKEACIRAALDGYEQAAMSGLCREGAWEAAVSAMTMVDLDQLLNEPIVE